MGQGVSSAHYASSISSGDLIYNNMTTVHSTPYTEYNVTTVNNTAVDP